MICYLILKEIAILSKPLFSFFLDKKKQKNQSTSWRIKSRNSPEDYNNLQLMPAQTALIS
jgi:hypothetical protein